FAGASRRRCGDLRKWSYRSASATLDYWLCGNAAGRCRGCCAPAGPQCPGHSLSSARWRTVHRRWIGRVSWRAGLIERLLSTQVELARSAGFGLAGDHADASSCHMPALFEVREMHLVVMVGESRAIWSLSSDKLRRDFGVIQSEAEQLGDRRLGKPLRRVFPGAADS